MNFVSAIRHYWTNYANFKGRTSRATYWWVFLFTVLVSIAISIVFPDRYNSMMGTLANPMDDYGYWTSSPVKGLWQLGTLLPSLAILVRRLHDTGKSGKNAWFALLPVVGWIILFVYTLQQGQTQENKYGEAGA